MWLEHVVVDADSNRSTLPRRGVLPSHAPGDPHATSDARRRAARNGVVLLRDDDRVLRDDLRDVGALEPALSIYVAT